MSLWTYDTATGSSGLRIHVKVAVVCVYPQADGSEEKVNTQSQTGVQINTERYPQRLKLTVGYKS